MRTRSTLLHRWLKDKAGASAVIFGLTLPLLVGFMGLGAEVGLWYMTQREIQTAADVAAYTGAIEMRSGESDSVVRSEATTEAARNGFDADTAEITITFLSDTRVRAEIEDKQQRLFSSLFADESTISIATIAEAEYELGGPACVLALNTIEFDALTFTGNTSVTLSDCNIMSNSDAARSINQTGSSDVTADCIYAAGGIDHNNNMTTTECDDPVEGVSPSVDPYEDVEVPEVLPDCETIPKFKPNNTFNLTAGRYCGDMSLKGDVDLAPGTYIFEGDFDINSGAIVTGDEVTIIMTGGELKFNGGAEIELSAATTGDYAGILFYQDRELAGQENVINGNANTSFTGAMYFPTNEVTMLGGAAISGGCLQLIADSIYFSGDTGFEHSCDDIGTRQIDIVGGVSIVL